VNGQSKPTDPSSGWVSERLIPRKLRRNDKKRLPGLFFGGKRQTIENIALFRTYFRFGNVLRGAVLSRFSRAMSVEALLSVRKILPVVLRLCIPQRIDELTNLRDRKGVFVSSIDTEAKGFLGG